MFSRTQETVMLALMSAILVIAQASLAVIPNVELVSLLIVHACYVLKYFWQCNDFFSYEILPQNSSCFREMLRCSLVSFPSVIFTTDLLYHLCTVCLIYYVEVIQ